MSDTKTHADTNAAPCERDKPPVTELGVSPTRKAPRIAALVGAPVALAGAFIAVMSDNSEGVGAGGYAFLTAFVVSPFVVGFLFAPLVEYQQFWRRLLVIVLVGSALWSFIVFAQPPGPSGRDGIVFLVLPAFQATVAAAVAIIGGVRQANLDLRAVSDQLPARINRR